MHIQVRYHSISLLALWLSEPVKTSLGSCTKEILDVSHTEQLS